MDNSTASQCRGGNTQLDSMILMGTILSGMTYGAVFTIYTLALSTSISGGYIPKASWRLVVTCWFWLLATTCSVLQIKWTLLAFVTQRLDNDPSVFIETDKGNWMYITLNALYVVINWSADGLLLFWFSCVFKQAPQWCVVLPVPLYIGSLVTGSLALREIATPGVTQDANELVNWLIIYRTVSVALCVTLTSLIAGRLVYSHRRLDSGSCNPKSRLLIVATMVVESAVLQTVFALVYVITVGLGSPLQNVFLPTLGQVQVVATMLIIYRVVRGRDATQELPHQSDLTQQTMSLRLNTAVATSFNSMGCELSASPTRSWRGFDSPRTLLPPPYAASPFHDHKTKIVPPLPSADAVHMLGLQGAGTKRTMTVRNVG